MQVFQKGVVTPFQFAHVSTNAREGLAVEVPIHIWADVGCAAERTRVGRKGAAFFAQVLTGGGCDGIDFPPQADSCVFDGTLYGVAFRCALRLCLPTDSLCEQDVCRVDAGRAHTAGSGARCTVNGCEGIEVLAQCTLNAAIFF